MEGEKTEQNYCPICLFSKRSAQNKMTTQEQTS